MTKLSENIIGKIKEQHICPVPRWHFLLKNYVFWGMFSLSVLLGSFSFSVILHIINSGDFDLLSHLKGNILTSGVMLLPVFWIISLAVFAAVAFINWKHTKHGYRLKRRWIFLSSIAISFFVGDFFYLTGLGKSIDMLMIKSVPLYGTSKHKARIELWQQPEKGLIIGRILDLQNDRSTFIVEDGSGFKWEIGNDVKNKTKSEINKIVNQGEIVKIIGDRKGINGFVAKDIRKCSDCDGDDDDYGAVDDDLDGK